MEVLVSFSPTKYQYSKNTEHCMQNKYKALKGRKRKDNRLGNPGPKELQFGEFPEFSLSLLYPRLTAEETGNRKCQQAQSEGPK